jgi:hypothetical protein
MLELEARARGLELCVTVEEDVPGELLGDPLRLRQVLINLVANGVKFTHEGGVSLHVARVGDGPDDTTLHIEVTDTGVGVPEELRSRLFEPFTQADGSMSRRYGGTGLGLAICKRLVTLMGGRLGVRANTGPGSTFWVELPAPIAGLGTQRSVPAPAAPVAAAAARRGAHILLVEDSPINQSVLVRMLEKLGHRVSVASDGASGVAAVRAGDHDLVLMDCQMPIMDGFTATARIRSSQSGPGRTPIVAMTANAVRGDRERCLLAGMDDYLAKPVTLEQLELMLQRWLSRAESSCVSAPPAGTAAGVARSPFDARVLAELRALYGSDEEVGELLADYLTQARAAQDAQDAALAARDLAAVAFEAHRMKSSSRFLGARRAARLYALLEGYGKKGMPERVTATAARLARELDLVEGALTARALPRSRARSVAAGDRAGDGPITTCAEA